MMKLFILAAGKGTRLWPLTKNTPKSLIELGDGSTLLEKQIVNGIDSGVFDEIVIITGYRAEQINAKIKEYRSAIKLTTVYNPFYDTTNNLVSLWAAHYMMTGDDFMITNGDNIYKSGVYSDVLNNSSDGLILTLSEKEHYDEDDMKVRLDGDRNILKVSKEISFSEAHAESVGLALVRGEKGRRIFVNKILDLVTRHEYLDRFWLEIFNSLNEDGIVTRTVSIDRSAWKEVDFHPDIELLRRMVVMKNEL